LQVRDERKGVFKMTTKEETPPKIEVIKKKARPAPEPGAHEHHKRRKHGYRGYPNKPAVGGDIHAGTGFGGVGSTAGAGASGSGLITEKTRESVEELAEEEEE
jgi:hypothetical protein